MKQNISLEESSFPTIRQLEKRSTENIIGSPLLKKKILLGKEYFFYRDGSVLIYVPASQEFHFLTAAGKKQGSDVRKKTAASIQNDTHLRTLTVLGTGKAGLSTVYSLPTRQGAVAIKASPKAVFAHKEKMGEVTTRDGDTIVEHPSGRNFVQKMALKDVMKVLGDIQKKDFTTAQHYGFSIKPTDAPHEIQELQYLEALDHPTMNAILHRARSTEESADVWKSFAYGPRLQMWAEKDFGGNLDKLLTYLVRSFHDFIAKVKAAIPHAGDILADNIFVTGYNAQALDFEFVIIDPFREDAYFTSERVQPSAERHSHVQSARPLIFNDLLRRQLTESAAHLAQERRPPVKVQKLPPPQKITDSKAKPY